MILVDTSVWVDYFNGRNTRETDTLDHLLGQELVIMGDIILTEVLQGFRSDQDFNKARAILSSFPVQTLLGKENAIISAQNYRLLQSKGATVRKTIDVIIGTFCIVNSIPLLHSDRDFEPMVEHLGLVAA